MKILMPRAQSAAIAPLPKLLDTLGHQVDVPSSYGEALAYFDRDHHAMIMVDLALDATAGLNFSCKIRTCEGGSVPFIVALADGADIELARFALDRGVSDVWSNDMGAERLAIRTEVALRLAHERQERHCTEARLQFEHERQKYIMAGLGEGFWDWELPDGNWRSAQRKIWNSKGLVKLMGFPENNPGMVNESWETFVHPEDRMRVQKALSHHIQHGQPFNLSCRMRGRRSEYGWYRNQGQAIFSRDGVVRRIVGSIRDISEQKQMEDRIGHNQRMEAVGALASCVAHDFNNVLLVLQGQCELLKRSLPEDTGAAERILEMKKALNKAGNMSAQLLTLSRKPSENIEAINLNEVVVEMKGILQHLLGKRISLKTRLDEHLASIDAGSGQIWRILLNLVLNARDAIEHSGEVTVATHYVGQAPPLENSMGLPPGEYVALLVSDTGCGMNAHQKSKVLEPFYTSKVNGKGTGLGLPVVNNIVRECGGGIQVDSAPAKGTSVQIYLPVTAQQAPIGNG